MYLFLLQVQTYMAAHNRAHPQVRPCKSFSYFYEGNVVWGLSGRMPDFFSYEADSLEMLSGRGTKSGAKGMFCFFIFSSRVVRLR